MSMNSASFRAVMDTTLKDARKQVSDFQKFNQRAGKQATQALLSATKASVGGVTALGAAVLATGKKLQPLEASLVTVAGSADVAALAFDKLAMVNRKMPTDLEDTVRMFAKLSNLGLRPTESDMISIANTASAMGKRFEDFAEAIADATTFEFERLKEFGIKARQNGDQVALTFQGNTTVIRKNADAVKEYLLAIGNAQFAGAAEREMNTISGALSNLSSEVSLFFNEIGREGGYSVIAQGINEISDAVVFSKDIVASVVDSISGYYQAYATEFVRFKDMALGALDAVSDGLDAWFDFSASGVGNASIQWREFAQFFPTFVSASIRSGLIKAKGALSDLWMSAESAYLNTKHSLQVGFADMRIGFAKVLDAMRADIAGWISDLAGVLDRFGLGKKFSVFAKEASISLLVTADSEKQVKEELKALNAEYERSVDLLSVRQSAGRAATEQALRDIQAQTDAVVNGIKAEQAARQQAREARRKAAAELDLSKLGAGGRSSGLSKDAGGVSDDNKKQAADAVRRVREETEQLRIAALERQEMFREAEQRRWKLEEEQLLNRQSSALEKVRGDEAAKQQILDEYKALREEKEKAHSSRLVAIDKASVKSRMDSLNGFLGNAAAALGKQTKAGKRAAQAQALINTYSSAVKAYDAMAVIPFVGPALGAAAAGAAIAFGMQQVRAIDSQSVAGIAHGGLDYVPKESTYLLDKGERVVSPNQNRELSRAVDRINRGGSGSVKVIINNNTDATATQREYETSEGRVVEVIVERARQAVAEDFVTGGGVVSRAAESVYGLRRGVA